MGYIVFIFVGDRSQTPHLQVVYPALFCFQNPLGPCASGLVTEYEGSDAANDVKISILFLLHAWKAFSLLSDFFIVVFIDCLKSQRKF